MAIVANTIRWVLNGTLPGNEEWHTGFWTMPDTPPANIQDLILSSAPVQVAANAFTLAWKSYWGTATWANSLSAYFYGGGEFGNKAEFSAEVPLTQNPGTGQEKLPNQCCVVASLRTGFAGRSYRGRMYLPTTNATITTGSQLAGATTDTMAAAVKTFLDSVNQGGQAVGVMSATQTSFTPVSTVLVDTIVDIQRRRADKLTPVKVSQVVLE